MKGVSFKAGILKFGKQGEKTGWTYVTIPQDIAEKLKPGNRKEFKVKGRLDNLEIKRVSVLPMGDGSFILPLNLSMRKSLAKKEGSMLQVQLEADGSEYVFNKDFITCMEDEPTALQFFQSLPGSHQRYFSKWIDSAKTEPTREKRIAMAVNALAKKLGYPEMLRNAPGKSI
jgi:hypothetical protein